MFIFFLPVHSLIVNITDSRAQKRGHIEEGIGANPAGPNTQTRKPLNASRSPVDCGTEC